MMSSTENRRAAITTDFNARPRVAMPARPWVMPAAIGVCLLLGLFVFWQLSAQRERAALAQQAPPPVIVQQAPAPAPVPVAPPAPPPVPEYVQQVPAPPANGGVTQADMSARLSSRALIVDLSTASAAAAVTGEDGASARDITNAVGGANADPNDVFASRLTRGASNARAQPPGDLANTVPEGSVIPAVLETALNSDLPGYTRAIVSRDVLSFDSSKVLVPRGSRLIGQYRSAVALGQSRAFVIWTRLVRPDGVNITLAEPGTDALGRGGLEGEVDTHFMRRFGGAILLSLISAGASAATSDSDTQVIIASTQGVGGVLQGELQRDIPPTVDVPQGAPIRIFVTRDLDFSTVRNP